MYKILMLEDDQYLLFQYEGVLKDNVFSVGSETDIKTFYNRAITSSQDSKI